MMRLFGTEFPPTVEKANSATLEGVTGVSVRIKLRVLPLRDAVMVTGVELATNDVEIAKLAEVVAPAATVTVAGTVASVVSEDSRLTTVPPVRPGPVRVTVAFTVDPPEAVVRAGVMACSVSGFSVSTAVRTWPL